MKDKKKGEREKEQETMKRMLCIVIYNASLFLLLKQLCIVLYSKKSTQIS